MRCLAAFISPPIFRPPATQAISHYPQMSIESILRYTLIKGAFSVVSSWVISLCYGSQIQFYPQVTLTHNTKY